MPVRHDPRTGGWYFRTTVKPPGGKKRRLFGTPGVPGPYHDLSPNEKGAIAAEQRAIAQAFADAVAAAQPTPPEKKEVPTFDEWFNGRFWLEWVVGRKNKPTEVRNKQSMYRLHLKDALGDKRLDEINVGEIARLRAGFVANADLGEKYINNILAVLSKALRYAADCEIIAKAPKVGLFKVERPEIVASDFAQYARLLRAAKIESPDWYAAVCLAGEAGLRVGEVKALRWREDVDLIARTITVNQQTRHKQTGTPKGRTRRTIPMTEALYHALRRLETIREGFVIRNLDGTQKTDGQADAAMLRICRRAGLPRQGFHRMRHSFGTHAALFGVNPWRLQAWMGHKRIDETMLYVHVAENHRRDIPEDIVSAGLGEIDPDRRVLKMLGARGSHVAAEISSTERTSLLTAV